MNLDAIDKNILRVIQGNSRVSIVELADKVGLSETPCARRVHKLQDEGVIQGYFTALDQAAVGLPVSVFVFIKLERQLCDNLDSFECLIGSLPEVIDCYLMSGRFDYLLRVVASDISHFEIFLKTKLTRIEGIASVESSFALNQILHRTNLPIP